MSTTPTAVLLEDASLLQQIDQIRAGRDDKTLTKTVRDLLREKVTEIRIKGDSLAVTKPEEGKPARRRQRQLA